jgi:ABC-type branched-subunit amino acid transport system substrate-binding protein
MLAVLLLVSACGDSSNTSSTTVSTSEAPTSTNAPSGATIKILLVSRQTGPAGEIGEQMCSTAQFAIEDINAEGGIRSGPNEGAQLEIECVDNPELTTEVATGAATRMLSDESIWAVIGFQSSGNALAAGKAVERDGLLVMGTTVGASFLTDEADNIAVMYQNTENLGALWVDVCANYFGGTSAVVVKGDSYDAGMHARAEETGFSIVEELIVPPNQQDVSPFITRAASSAADCGFIGEFPPTTQQWVVQARQLGWNVPLVDYGSGGASQSAIDVGGIYLKGFLFGSKIPGEAAAGALDAQEGFELLTRYNQHFTEKYGEPDLNGTGAYTYETVLAFRAAVEAGDGSREGLVAAIPDVETPGLLQPTITFGDDMRISERSLWVIEQVGPELTDMEEIAEYLMTSDGNVTRVSMADCGERETCQINSLASDTPFFEG